MSEATKQTVAQFVTNAVKKSRRSLEEIAEEVGYSDAKAIEMLMKGITKLPFNKTGAIAKAIYQEPAELLTLALNEYMPGFMATLEECLIDVTPTPHERRVIGGYREISGGKDVDVIVTRTEWTAIVEVEPD